MLEVLKWTFSRKKKWLPVKISKVILADFFTDNFNYILKDQCKAKSAKID